MADTPHLGLHKPLGTDKVSREKDLNKNLDKIDKIVEMIGIDKQKLVVKLNTTNPTYQVDIDADYLQVEEYNLSSVNLTVDITQSGANGLDTGSEAAHTWYSIWVIYNPTTSTTAGLLSTSEIAPTMPSGYTKKRMVGHVRNGASSNFNDTGSVAESFGDDFHDRGDPASSDFTLVNFITDGAWHSLNLFDVVPVGAKTAALHILVRDDAVGSDLYIRKKGNTNIANVGRILTQSININIAGDIIIACDADRVIEYLATDTTWSTINVTIEGWWR